MLLSELQDILSDVAPMLTCPCRASGPLTKHEGNTELDEDDGDAEQDLEEEEP